MLVLLDRDGVINRDAKEGILRIADFHFLPNVLPAIARLTHAGCTLAICTNQSAVGRGRISEADLEAIHAHMLQHMRAAGGEIHRIYHAPDVPERPTDRRKPGPGMLREALQHFQADPARTPMVGDMLRDLQAAHAVGCPRILVHSGKGAQTAAQGIPPELAPVTQVADLMAAAEHILTHYR